MYALWRWHDTLPTFAFSVQNFWQYFFFAFEALAIVYTLMSISSTRGCRWPSFSAVSIGPGSRELMERQSERLDKYPEVKGKVTASSP
jgi:hypothetical protein